jgi:cytosine/adenosine deaminase-related metal-dependent hydrolase
MKASEALSIAAEGGAKLLGYEKLGRIEEGYLADLALFDVQKLEYAGALSDPAAALVLCGYNHGADHVIVNGSLILESGRLVGSDEETIRNNANRASRRLLEKAGLA